MRADESREATSGVPLLAWGVLMTVLSFGVLAVGTAALASQLRDPARIVVGAGRYSWSGLTFDVRVADLPLVIGVPAAVLLAASLAAIVVRRVAPRVSRGLATGAGFASLVVAVAIGVSLLAPDWDPRAVASIALGSTIPASILFSRVPGAPDFRPVRRKRRSSGPR